MTNYVHSPFRDFESYLRVLGGLNGDDFQLILKQDKSKFITYKFTPGVHTFRDLSEVHSRGFKKEIGIRGRIRPKHTHDRSDSINIEKDNAPLITKLDVHSDIHVLRCDKKSFFKTKLGFKAYWLYTNYSREYHSEKKRILGIIHEIYLKGVRIDGSVLNGVRQPILYSFVLHKPPGYKIFCEPE